MAFKVYMEITNRCNLACAFCPGTKRRGQRMTMEQFERYASAVAPMTDYLYFHLMGEPLLHPLLPDMIRRARALGMKPIVTTNGTLLAGRGRAILEAGVHKVSISLHSFEANDGVDFDRYLTDCIEFASLCPSYGAYCALRLWNLGSGGRAEYNQAILRRLSLAFPDPWTENRSGYRLTDGVYLEWGEHFEWPEMGGRDLGSSCFCLALRDQIGVLCDGSVVPCCLDREGDLVLGHLDEDSLEQILASPRALAIRQGFTNRTCTQALCRTCGFAHDRFAVGSKGEGKDA